MEFSVRTQEIEVDGLLEELGGGGNALVFEFNFACATLVVLGTNVVVVDAERQDHVVEGVDVERKGLVPDGVAFVAFGGRDLGSVVLVAELQNHENGNGNETSNTNYKKKKESFSWTMTNNSFEASSPDKDPFVHPSSCDDASFESD